MSGLLPGAGFTGALVTPTNPGLTGVDYTTAKPIEYGTEVYDIGGWHGFTATITVTIATPGVVTWTAHGFRADTAVVFTTTGALPTGITAGTTYYIKTVLSADTFSIAATPGGAAINTTGTQSGVHTGTNSSVIRVPAAYAGRYGLLQANIVTGSLTADLWDFASIRQNGLTAWTGVGRSLTESGLAAGCGIILTQPHVLVAADDYQVFLQVETDTAIDLLYDVNSFGIRLL